MNERILQKIGRIRECLAVLGSIKEDCTTRFMSDPVYRGAVLHYLYQVADSCISLAELVIRARKLRPPQSYHEAFDILGEAGVIDPEFAYSFAKIAGFRNFLAHDYERADAKAICEQALEQLGDVEEFLRQIRRA